MLQVMISEVFGEELSALRGVGLIHWNLSQLNKVRLDGCTTCDLKTDAKMNGR